MKKNLTICVLFGETSIVGRQYHSYRIKHQLLNDIFIHTE